MDEMGADGFARDVMPCIFVHLVRPLSGCRETLPCRPSGSNWRRIGRSPNCRNVMSHRLGVDGHLTLEQMKLSPRTKAPPRLWKAARENKEPVASLWHGGCRDGRKGALRDRKGAERNEHGHRRGYLSWCRAQKLCLELNMYPPRVPRPHRDYDPQCATRRRSQCPEMVLGKVEWGERRDGGVFKLKLPRCCSLDFSTPWPDPDSHQRMGVSQSG
ncbi:hypothetical protein B0T18DRAFT_95491 [Schizothecium vesticola]|uniref:Uncharacterized protein n=1 Tax=Schizothecium vesticola TaxID=314040 RepID=A0AA40F0K6_9PEZI|nr:hypothetical protein B0T18DRAFT_95491 [Schizothecium vesticola]